MPDTSLETIRNIASAAVVPLLGFLLGRGARNAREKLDIRTADQTDIKRLSERLEKLEGRVDTLMTEKFVLEQRVVQLTTDIGKLEVLKLQYESRDATSALQIQALEVRLAVKEEELRCVKEELRAVTEKMHDTENKDSGENNNAETR